MALQRKQVDCVSHELSILSLQKDVKQIKANEYKKNKMLETLDKSIDGFNISLTKIESKLDALNDVNSKIRKLEDKTIFFTIVEKLLWLSIGAFITIAIHQNYIANREEKNYKPIKEKTK